MYKPWEKMPHEEAGATSTGGGATPSITDGGTTPQGGAQTSDTGAGAGANWLEGLGDLGKDPSLQMFKDPGALAKSWVNAQKMIGANKVVIPGDNATEEEVNAFYQKLGRPEAPDKYEIKAREGREMDKDFSTAFKGAAFKAGLNPKQVQALADWYDGAAEEAMKNSASKGDAELREALNQYKQTLGGEDKFNATIDRARTAVRSLTDEPFQNFLRETGMGSRPEVIDFFSKLAGMMSEDKIRDGSGVPFSNQDPDSIQREIEELESKMFKDINSTNMSAWVDQRMKLYERLNSVRRTG